MRTAALALTFIAWTMAPAGAGDAVSVDIVEHGIYMAEITSTVRDPNGIQRNVLANICHVATTRTVPAKYGLHFGFRFRVNGGETGQLVNLKKAVVFPTVMTLPGLAKPLTMYDYAFSARTGLTSYTGYSFDHAWEFVPGTWTFQILQRERKLAELRFTVVDGTDMFVPPAGNANCFRISAGHGWSP